MGNKTFFKHYLVSVICLSIIACAKVNFSSAGDPCSGNNSICTSALGQDAYDYSVTMATQPIDVLFVVDNSASMYAIQQSIGQKFPSLFSTLKQYDYHVAVTTTDISSTTNPPSTLNQSGALQDGKLISLADGTSFISSSSSNPDSLFSGVIARPETLACEQWIKSSCPAGGCIDITAYHQNCPSEDTRAIAASQLNLTSDSTGFLRNNAPIAIVILSNADERASGGTATNSQPLTQNDMPAALISAAAALNKPLSVYSIIIQPGDTSCYQAQDFSSTLFGWYGTNYQNLAQQTGGASSSICASDFSANLNSIGSGITKTMESVTLKCAPINNTVTVFYGSSSAQTVKTSSSSPTTLTLPEPLSVGQSVRLKYSCSQSH